MIFTIELIKLLVEKKDFTEIFPIQGRRSRQ
jgi:hypothetical protein